MDTKGSPLRLLTIQTMQKVGEPNAVQGCKYSHILPPSYDLWETHLYVQARQRPAALEIMLWRHL